MTELTIEHGVEPLPWTLGFDDENIDRDWALEQSPLYPVFDHDRTDNTIVYTCRIDGDFIVVAERCFEIPEKFWLNAYHRTTGRWRGDDCIVSSPLEAMAIIHEWNKGRKTPCRYGPEITEETYS